MRMQELREALAEKMRDELFNEIKPMMPVRKEWRIKSVEIPVQTPNDDEDDLLDYEGSPMIRDDTPPHEDMDINMVFTLPSEFRIDC